jgi:hypothetical protein
MFSKLIANKETQRMVVVSMIVSVLVYLLLGSVGARTEFMCGKSHYNYKGRGRKLLKKKRSNYALKPRQIMTAGEEKGANVLDGLKYDMECTPGLENGAYYSKSLTPGGFCGDQAAVNDAMHKYTIESGVGGSLMDQ